jgi:uncharacterized LabA/DUF88 family protein
MKEQSKNCAYIDGANLHKGVKDLGWHLDYKRFRIWLKEKYQIKKAYLFIGLVSKHKNLYTFLQEAGFTLVFKETICDGDGKIKGNCDADLVLKSVVDFYEHKCEKAVIVSSDGDYASLVEFLKSKGAFAGLISPSDHCSFLLRNKNISLVYLRDKKNVLKLIQKEKTPDADGTA